MDKREILLEIYHRLDRHFGDLHWWPAESPFEVMVGTILTQNTAWTNAERAIDALRKRDVLNPMAISGMAEEDLAELIRPSGCYRQKATRLKALVSFFIEHYSGCIDGMRAERCDGLRRKLLTLHGIGKETSDSILLYACQKPIFVVDAYTRRLFHRHGLVEETATYDEVQALVMASLPNDVAIFNQYHALIVVAAKTFCKKKPTCRCCPLESMMRE